LVKEVETMFRSLREKVDAILDNSAEKLLNEIVDSLVEAAEMDGITDEDLLPKAIVYTAFQRVAEVYKPRSSDGQEIVWKISGIG
jgi:RNA 3'-terminal phosphate cyclase